MKNLNVEENVPMYCISDRCIDITRITSKIFRNDVLIHVIYVTQAEAEEIYMRKSKEKKFDISEFYPSKDLTVVIKKNLIKLGYLNE